MVNQTSSEVAGCILLHPGFQSVFLTFWVLETAHGEHSIEEGKNDT